MTRELFSGGMRTVETEVASLEVVEIEIVDSEVVWKVLSVPVFGRLARARRWKGQVDGATDYRYR